MTDPDTDNKSNNGAENEKTDIDNSVSVPVDDIDEKAQFISSNGGAGDHPEVAIVDGTDQSAQVSFNGLGKDEVLQYANDPFWVRLRWVLFILFWVGWFAMLVTAIAIIVLAPRCPPRPDMKWYQKETVYQAYSKSFKDSDKDGYGDFAGFKDKFDYITDDLGAKVVYLNSIFKTDESHSRAEENDLAIIDHKDLDPKFKTTVGKFKSWIKDQRKDGKNVIVDLIPNQTSKKHEWFMKSAEGKDEKFKDYYIWAGTPGSPPNYWKDSNGDPAWEFDSDRNEYYYHSRSKDLPDLNLRSAAVKEEIKDIMKFWFGAGVGGFNIQDLEYLVENSDHAADDENRTHTRNYPETLELLTELRKVANSYSDKPGRERFLFGNVMYADQNQTLSYWGDDDEKALHLVLQHMPLDFDQNDAFSLRDWIGMLPDDRKQWLGMQLGNEDTSRIGSRVTSVKTSSGLFVKIAHAIQMLLPGTPFNYYGDEFGQRNGNESDLTNGRFNPLNARTPMQWSDQPNAGFTDPGITPWVAVGPDYKSNNKMKSGAHYNDESVLNSLIDLIELRSHESFQWGKTKACATNKDVLMFTRKAERFPYFLTLINMGKNDYSPHLPSVTCVDSKDKGEIVFHSRNEGVGLMLDLEEKAIRLEEGDVIVLKFSADD